MPHKDLVAPDEGIPKTASARIPTWAIAAMGFDFKLNFIPREKIPHNDVFSRVKIDEKIPTTIECAVQSKTSTSTSLRVIL